MIRTVLNLLCFDSHLVIEAYSVVQVCKEENYKYPEFSREAGTSIKAQEDRNIHFN